MEKKKFLIEILAILLLALAPSVSMYSQIKHWENLYTDGMRAMQSGNINTAILCFEDALNNVDKGDSETCSILLYHLGTCYVIIEQPEKACALFEQAISASKEDPILMINIYPSLLQSYTVVDGDKASLTAQNMEKLLKEGEIGSLHWAYATALLTYYQSVSNHTRCLDIGDWILTQEISTVGCSDSELLSIAIEQNTFYMSMALCYEALHKDKEALNCWKLALTSICDETERNIPTICSSIGTLYQKQNDKANALKFYLMALENWEKCDNIEEYAETRAMILMEIGVILQQEATPITAIPYLEEAKDIYIKIKSTEYLPYTYTYLYSCYQSIGNIEKATSYADLLLTTINEVNKWKDEQFLSCYSTYGSILENQGKHKEAVSVYQRVLEKELQLYGDNDMRLFPNYYKLAALYLDLNYIDSSIEIINKALILVNRFTGRTEELLLAKLLLIEIDQLKGNLGKAISDCENLKDQVSLLNDSSIVRSHYWSILGRLYGEIGAYDKFLDASIKDCETALKLYGENSPKYAVALLNLSGAYAVCDNQTEALNSNIKALDLLKNIYGKQSRQYYVALHKLGSKYSESDPNKSLDIYSECMKLSRYIYGEKSNEYADDILMYYRTRILLNLSDMKEADIIQYTKGLNIKREIGATNTSSYFTALSLLGAFYYAQNDYENRFLIDKEYYAKVKEYIKDNFVTLTEWQRDVMWNKFQTQISYIPSGAVETRTPASNKLAYNCMLLSKALLLTCVNSSTELVQNSNDEQLMNLHKKIANLKDDIMITEDDSLYNLKERELAELQREEMNRIREIGSFVDFVDIDWSDIRNALRPKEAAIEFISYPTQDNISYAAIVLTSETMYPMIYPLFNDKELEMYVLQNSEMDLDYGNPEIYRIVWNRLESYALDEIETIYFSPDGILHKIPIENLIDAKGNIASQKWNIFRVSSTRELIKKKDEVSQTKAALYGGLNYDIDITDMEDSQQTFDEIYIAQYRSEPDSIGLRARYGTLRGTLDEVQLIDSLYSNLKFPSVVYAHNIGTETSLKKLDGQKVSNLHIATHGFYWTETELNEKKDLRELPFIRDYDRPRFIEDKAMTRSGLLFAGANKVLSGESIPEGYDDGILTAKEISTLDLRGLDLLVLSACQTGLGEIKGDGVYGLQRGFKMAGAQTIVMSLWKVDDDATQMLMTEFYKRYLSGQSKHEAFLAAQEVVRNFRGKIRGDEKDFSDPMYWAGFIMLDALDSAQ